MKGVIALSVLIISGCSQGGGSPILTVDTSADIGGSVEPAIQLVQYGIQASFTVTPQDGYLLSGISGCNGSLEGSTYTTGAITQNCTVSASFAAPPEAPLNLQLSADNASLDASWDAVANANGYTLYLSESPGIDLTVPTSYALRVTTSDNSHHFSGLNNFTTYYLVVTASVGLAEGAAGNEGSAMPEVAATAHTSAIATTLYPYPVALFFSGNDANGDDFKLQLGECSSGTPFYQPALNQHAFLLDDDGSIDNASVTALSDLFQSSSTYCTTTFSGTPKTTLATSFHGTDGKGWYVLLQSLRYDLTLKYDFTSSDGSVKGTLLTRTVRSVVPNYAPKINTYTPSGWLQAAGDRITGEHYLLDTTEIVDGLSLPGLDADFSLAADAFPGLYLLIRPDANITPPTGPGPLSGYIENGDATANTRTTITLVETTSAADPAQPAPAGHFALTPQAVNDGVSGQFTISPDGQSVAFNSLSIGGYTPGLLLGYIYWIPDDPTGNNFAVGDRFKFRYQVEETSSSNNPCPIPVLTSRTVPDTCLRSSSVDFWAEATSDPSLDGEPIPLP